MTTSLDKADTSAVSAPHIDTEQLDRSLVHGIAWTGAAKWAGQVIAWTSTLIVARLLSPTDYGIVSLATVYLGVITLMSDFGVGTGVVALRGQTEQQLAQLNGLSVLLGIAGFTVSCLIAVPAGHFFRSPQLPVVMVIMSTSFVISSFRSVPASLLQKELRFKALSIIEGIRTVSLAFITVALALAGLRYWTLVASTIISTVIGTALILSQKQHSFALPRFSEIKEQIRFSRNVIVGTLAWYVYSNADFVVSGRMLGEAALGTYTVAWNFANAPLEKITTLVGSVTPAVFSAVQADIDGLRRYLLKSVEAVSLVAFPALIGMALVARDGVLLALGEKWMGVVVPLQLLALYACVRSIMPLLSQVLLVTGDTAFLSLSGVLGAIIMPAAFLVGSRWGISGIAAAWVAAYPVAVIPLCLRTARRIEIHGRDYFNAIRPALHGSLSMAAVVLVLRLVLHTSVQPALRFSMEIVLGAVTYILVGFVFHRERVLIFKRAARML